MIDLTTLNVVFFLRWDDTKWTIFRIAKSILEKVSIETYKSYDNVNVTNNNSWRNCNVIW